LNDFFAKVYSDQYSVPHDRHYDAGEGSDITYSSMDFILGFWNEIQLYQVYKAILTLGKVNFKCLYTHLDMTI